MSAHPSNPPRFAVLQMGARLHYAVPALLQRRGMLQCLVTDAVSPGARAKHLVSALPPALRRPTVERLFTRVLPTELAGATVVTAPLHTAAERLLKLSHGYAHSRLRERMLRKDFFGATALYILDNSDLELARAARRRGMFVVYEQICDARIGRLVAAERAKHPHVERHDTSQLVEAGISRDVDVWNECDLILAASDLVADSIRELGGPADRVAIVPYGIPESWFTVQADPSGNRVLFVGRASLPKGAHHFAASARALRAAGVRAEFRAVGATTDEVRTNPLFVGVDWHGMVARDRLRDEYASARVMALPTASDGFALAVLEAMGSGVPVITTDRCGSIIRDGIDGFIVPYGDMEALTNRIRQLLTDDALHAKMAKATRERARDYTWNRYEERLVTAINERYSAKPRHGAA